jgi:hypothetical protein
LHRVISWPYSHGSEILTIAEIIKKSIYAAEVNFEESVTGISLPDEAR